MKKILLLGLFILLIMISFVSAEAFLEPGTYEVQPGDTITFNDLTIKVIDIKTNDNNVSWNQDFGREMVFLSTSGVGFYVYVSEKMELTRAKYSDEKPIAVLVNSIDLENKKAIVQFIDNLKENSEECIEEYTITCYHLNVHWKDSCGELGLLKEECSSGCEDGICKENIPAGSGSSCGDNVCAPSDFFARCFEDCPTDIVDPLDINIKYNINYGLEEERTYEDDYYSLKINNEGNEAFDMRDVAFVVTGPGRGVVQYQNFAEDIINSGETKNYEIKIPAVLEDLCGQEFSFALRKMETERLYSFDGGKFLKCVKVYAVEPIEKKPIEIPKGNDEIIYTCNGCELDKKCYPFGYRKSGKYCSDNNEFVTQLEAGKICDNSFECKSNVCVSGECISEGLLKKILNWFRRIFSMA